MCLYLLIKCHESTPKVATMLEQFDVLKQQVHNPQLSDLLLTSLMP